mmetsp:Transcript_5090/g.9291  ORF Transcript_5090/g.9291 Transcript_5090/m.9291 type:complete len:253 (-) Transcript_5090:66-824(-)|eukprot:CAMPEP_0184701230 /NCGR_PEP_ID=MMETSP0313-20130426/18769_1 /TAXON_ID=2792 /ORGANISM="Porphyridium aerugineum, Strain SAG 1380-2" /LENGTH=252 /DNA_ID=CAMNT_0027161215 /DNA_START=69 /DNA_END=827 /DNA_ORIENTATION=+
MALFQPTNQVRLTNVVVVRLKKKGYRFEIACYPNKVVSWRNKTETDLDEVLQIEQVFSNVSKGVLAPSKQLQEAFGTEDIPTVVKVILEKGEVQVSSKERQHTHDQIFQEIATIVSEKCVDPSTKRPFTAGMIERAMRDTLHYAVVPNKSSKQQALDVINKLKEHMEIERAQMEVLITLPGKTAKAVVKDKVHPLVAKTVQENYGSSHYTATCYIDPGQYRNLEQVITEETRGQGTIEIINFAVMNENESIL